MLQKWLGCVLLLALVLSVTADLSTDMFVDGTSGRDDGSCGTVSHPCRTLHFTMLTRIQQTGVGFPRLHVAPGVYSGHPYNTDIVWPRETTTSVPFHLIGTYGSANTTIRCTTPNEFAFQIQSVRQPWIQGFTIENCAWIDNSHLGGAIYIENSHNANLTDVVFRNNDATGVLSHPYGGALFIRSTNVYLKRVVFENNRAQLGGAIYLENGDGYTVEMEDCSFSGNMAVAYDSTTDHSGFIGGGAIYAGGSFALSMKNVAFYNNRAEHSNGGALYVSYGTVTMNDVRMYDSFAQSDGGALALASSSASVSATNLLVTRSTANGNGIAMHMKGGSLTVRASNISDNRGRYLDCGSSCSFGGVLIVQSGSAHLIDCDLNNNAAHAGSVLHLIEGTVKLDDCRMESNSGWSHTLYQTGGSLTVSGGALSNTNVSAGGSMYSAIPVDNLKASFSLTNFSGNVAVTGSGMEVTGSQGVDISFHSCYFQSNSAYSNGGVFASHSLGNPLVFTNCTFDKNNAFKGFGGALYLRDSARASLQDCTFLENSAAQGGAIAVQTHASASCTGCTFQRNKAAEGGALHLSSVSQFSSCQFLSNVADIGGAVVLDGLASVEAQPQALCDGLFDHGTVFDSNSAEVTGGAVYWDGDPWCHNFCQLNVSRTETPGLLWDLTGHPSLERLPVVGIDTSPPPTSAPTPSPSLAPVVNPLCEFRNNVVEDNSYGANVAFEVDHVVVTGVRPAAGNGTIVLKSSGDSFDVSLNLFDAIGQLVPTAANDFSATLTVSLMGAHPPYGTAVVDSRFSVVSSIFNASAPAVYVHLNGATTKSYDKGVVTFRNVGVDALPGLFAVRVSSSGKGRQLADVVFMLDILPCPPTFDVRPTEDSGVSSDASFNPVLSPSVAVECVYELQLGQGTFSSALQQGIIAAGSIHAVICVMSLGWVFWNRHARIWSKTDLSANLLFLFGLLLLFIEVAASIHYPPDSIHCMLDDWLGSIAFALVYGTCFAKIALVVRNHLYKKKYARQNSDLMLRYGFGVTLPILLTFLTIWTLQSPPGPVTVRVYAQDDIHAVGNSAEDFVVCAGSAYWDILVFFGAAVMLCGTWFSFRTSHIKTRYNERLHVAITFYLSLLLMILLWLWREFWAKGDLDKKFTLERVSRLFLGLIPFWFVFIPKVVRHKCPHLLPVSYETMLEEQISETELETQVKEALEQTTTPDGKFTIGDVSDSDSDHGLGTSAEDTKTMSDEQAIMELTGVRNFDDPVMALAALRGMNGSISASSSMTNMAGSSVTSDNDGLNDTIEQLQRANAMLKENPDAAVDFQVGEVGVSPNRGARDTAATGDDLRTDASASDDDIDVMEDLP